MAVIANHSAVWWGEYSADLLCCVEVIPMGVGVCVCIVDGGV